MGIQESIAAAASPTGRESKVLPDQKALHKELTAIRKTLGRGESRADEKSIGPGVRECDASAGQNAAD